MVMLNNRIMQPNQQIGIGNPQLGQGGRKFGISVDPSTGQSGAFNSFSGTQPTPPFNPNGGAINQQMQPTRYIKQPFPQQPMQQQGQQMQPMQQTMQQQMQPMPQYGLSGAEQALQGGLQGGLSALSQGQNQGLNTLQFGNQFAQNQLQQGQNALSQGNVGAQNQLQQGINALGGNFNAQAASVNTGAGQGQFQQAAQGVNQFTPEGLRAQGLQGALSGSQGQEAFDAARLNNPYIDFLNQRGQEALVNQSAASGGLGSGAFQADLQQLGQAQAGSQIQQQIQNLGQLSGQGLQAAGQAGQFLSQAGQQQAQLAAQNAQMQQQTNLSNASNRLTQAQNIGQLFGQGANFQNQLGQNQANLFGQGGSLAANLASQGAGFQNQGGINAANLFSSAGQNVAQNRFQTGTNLATQIGQSTSALSDLARQQGSGNADIIGQGGVNIANLLQNAGQLDASQQQQLATLLSNLAIGQGTQQAGFTQQAGNDIANSNLAATEGQQEIAGTVLGGLAKAFSDERLKENIVNIGNINGVNFYNWTWNDKMPIKELIGKESQGVLAQELEFTYPDLVINNDISGFKKVDYSGLGELLWQV